MARSSRKRIGLLPAGPMSGAVLLSLVLAAGQVHATAATSSAPPPTKVAAKADSAKHASTTKPTVAVAAPANKPAGVAAAPANKPAAVAAAPANKPATVAGTPASKPASGVVASGTSPASGKISAPPAVKPVPRSRLVTMPSSAPTRATAMPHPEVLRAVLIQKASRPKAAPANLAQAAGPKNVASPANPRGAVTLTEAKPGAPVPMGIPVADSKLAADAKNAKGARVVAAAATGSGSTLRPTAPPPNHAPTVGGGPQVSKMTIVPPGKQGTAVGGPTRAPTVGAGKGAVVPAPPALEDQVAYQYNALGRRDPFNSLLEGAFVGDDVGGDAPPDLGGLKVVGIMWGERDQFAMCEDVKGNSYVLRRGDKVMNGVVESLTRESVTLNITVDGQSQSVTVPITRKGEKSNANR